jgi:hypothetical protein
LGTGGYVSIGTGGDINNDGFDDFLIGNTNHRNSDSIMVGAVIGFWGGNFIDLSSEAFNMEGNQKWFEYGKSINIAGDINGDGYADVFILQPSYPDYNNPTGKLFIYSYAKITGINNTNINIPANFKLNQNYPNPFNPTTTINYQIPKNGKVTLKVYDILGRKVITLVNGFKAKGRYSVQFNGSNLASGIYFYKLSSGDFSAVKKLILLK